MIQALLLNPKLIGGAAIVLGIFSAGWITKGHFAAARLAKVEAQANNYRATAERKAREAADKARAREDQITAKAQEIINEANALAEKLRSDAAAADVAGRGMLDAARRTAQRGCNAPSAAAASTSASGPVPADMSDASRLLLVLGRIDGAAGEYAAAAGSARAAGQACERAYETAREALK